MDPERSLAPSPEQVAVFFEKHRTGLVTLVFTDLVDSSAFLHALYAPSFAEVPVQGQVVGEPRDQFAAVESAFGAEHAAILNESRPCRWLIP